MNFPGSKSFLKIFTLCLLFCNSSKHMHLTRLICLVDHLMKSFDLAFLAWLHIIVTINV